VRPLRVAVLGDAYVVGVGDQEARGWVGRLAQRTAAAGVDATVYGLGIHGEPPEDLAQRWRRELRPRLPPAVEGRVVLAAGSAPRAPERAAATLLTVARGMRGRRWGVLVVGPPPSPDPAALARLEVLDAALARGCAHHGLPYVAVLAPLLAQGSWCAEAAAGDGRHPGPAGYDVLAGVVWNAGWLAWLTRKSPAGA